MADEGQTAKQASGDNSAAQPGDAWGDAISEERQAYLRDLFEQQQEWAAQPEVTRGESVFKDAKLTGAEAYWLAECSGRDAIDGVPNLHLEGVDLIGAHLERALLTMAHLEGADLSGAYLEGAGLIGADLEGANLFGAHLEGANLFGAHLERALLTMAHLEGADLSGAHLEGADLNLAHLEGRRYTETTEDRAALKRIRQSVKRRNSIYRFPDILPPADLRGAYFDRATQLQGATLGDADQGYVRVADTLWGEVNLAVVDWPEKPILRDELGARRWKPTPFHPDPKDKRPVRQQRRAWREERQAARLNHYRAATRAYRQLATVLRTQGMNDEADRFAYRAQVLQRTVFRLQRRQVRWGFSALLDAIAGYGYKPERTLFAYLTAIIGFADAYYSVGQLVGPHLSPLGAVVFSMTSFHGRGFFPGGIALDDPLTVLAAFEALVGLVVEVSLIATFTQRFFAR